MAVLVYEHLIRRQEAIAVLVFGIIGVVLLVLARAKPSRELASATAR